MNLDEILANAVATPRESTVVSVCINDTLLNLRFTAMDARLWVELASASPIRPNVPLDLHYGYNYDHVSTEAARQTGVLVTDVGDQPIADDEWDRMLVCFTGRDMRRIVDAVWTLNEYGPEQRAIALTDHTRDDGGAA